MVPKFVAQSFEVQGTATASELNLHRDLLSLQIDYQNLQLL